MGPQPRGRISVPPCSVFVTGFGFQGLYGGFSVLSPPSVHVRFVRKRGRTVSSRHHFSFSHRRRRDRSRLPSRVETQVNGALSLHQPVSGVRQEISSAPSAIPHPVLPPEVAREESVGRVMGARAF